MIKSWLKGCIFTGLFLVPFVPFLVYNSFFFPFITSKAFTWRIIVEIVFSAWILLVFIDANYRPKRSVILYSILGFLAVIGLADLFGVEPLKSFWSNFERMEGYITLLHLGMFFLVISSVFKEDEWKRWWNTSLVASFLMVMFCMLQLMGLKNINQGGVRVDGTLGNAIYLAVYMLFHIFIALLFMWREWKNVALRWIYGLLIIAQTFILYSTATRGAILGLLGGVLVMAILNIRNKESRFVRRTSIAILVGLVILVGGFMAIKDTKFVQDSPVLSRFSSLTTEEVKTQGRYFVWPMALEGVKERPLLGWGQENFSYVFQKHYDPQMFRLEPWFDRAHNIFLDWAVSGGLLGLLSYLFLYVALLLSIWKPNGFSHTEKSILTGLIAAYFFHNFFVFDHLISYILFFSLLSYVHYRNGGKLFFEVRTITKIQMNGIALPAVAVLLVLSIYFVNIKPIMANVTLIHAMQSLQKSKILSIQYFKNAFNASRLGHSEIVEQIVSNSTAIFTSDISIEEKNAYFKFVKEAILSEEKGLGADARYQIVAGSFLSTVGLLDESIVHLNRARELIPGKQQVYFEIGAAYVNKQEPLKALEIFKQAYELAPEYLDAKLVYLIGAIYAGDRAVENEMISKLTESEVAFDDRIINAYHSSGRTDKVVSLLESRITLDPDNAEKYKALIKQVGG